MLSKNTGLPMGLIGDRPKHHGEPLDAYPMSVYAPTGGGVWPQCASSSGFVLCAFCGDSVACLVEGSMWKYQCDCGAEGVYFPDKDEALSAVLQL